jgi:hypothetical protein
METEAELQAQLLTVQTAIQALIAGERISVMEIGSPEFRRKYQFGEVTLEALREERANIQQKLAALSTTEPTFRETSPHYMSWSKQ